ncbi:MAG: rhomboid family intramembrane serine protease [Planctomycetaceae bacterium]|nr:rhomboid family intramembrane serine protease [Planctomycetaceae bacterium]
MGLENRDYLRDEEFRYGGGWSSSGGRRSYTVWQKILIATIVVYVLQMLTTRSWTQEELNAERDRMIEELRLTQQDFGDPEGHIEKRIRQLEATDVTPRAVSQPVKRSIFQEWLELDSAKVLHGQIWRLLTCALCHDRHNPFHIFFNMLLLFFFGRTVEAMYGEREFLWFYIGGTLTASVAFMLLDLFSGELIPMIGASGAVWAVIMVFTMHYPRQVVRLFFIFPMELWLLVLFYAIYDLHPVLLQLAGENPESGIAHAAHVGGMVFGFCYYHFNWRLTPAISNLEVWWKSRRRGLRVVRSEPESDESRRTRLAAEMDTILAKISEHGEASLTAAERKTLERVSRELRNRRT